MLVKVISFSILHAVQEPRDGTNHGYKLSQSLGPIFLIHFQSLILIIACAFGYHYFV